jgi:hypothetical protein
VRMRLLAAALLALTVTGGGPAFACDYAPALTVDEVLAAGPGGSVPFFGRQATLVGVVEHQVTATSPTLIPVTSARVSTTRIRSWGQAESDMDHIPVEPRGQVPYLGGLGDSCGPFRAPPEGASIVTALVSDGEEIDRASIGPESYVFHFAEGLTDDTRNRLDESFGAGEVYETGLATRIRAAAVVWWPHVIAAVSLLAAVVFTVRRVRRRRPIATHR